MSLATTVSMTVLKPVADVFAAVLRPVPYFVDKANGPMTAGTTVIWQFPEMAAEVPVIVDAVEANKRIAFRWDGVGGMKNSVVFTFSPLNDKGRALAAKLKIPSEPATTVSVTESGWPDTPDGRQASLGNTMGWTHMLSALKGHLEHGVNLRHGAFLHFDFPA